MSNRQNLFIRLVAWIHSDCLLNATPDAEVEQRLAKVARLFETFDALGMPPGTTLERLALTALAKAAETILGPGCIEAPAWYTLLQEVRNELRCSNTASALAAIDQALAASDAAVQQQQQAEAAKGQVNEGKVPEQNQGGLNLGEGVDELLERQQAFHS